jgi:hypothetical protein
MFVFGVSYAVASLSCTLPIFLSLVGGIVSADSFGTSVLAFTAYGAGMAASVTGVTLVVAAGNKTVMGRIRRLARHLDTISGVVMTAAGGFIVWYWATILSGGGVALGGTGLVRWIDRTSATVTGLLGRNAVVVALVVVGVVVIGWFASPTGRPPDTPRADRRTGRPQRLDRVSDSDRAPNPSGPRLVERHAHGRHDHTHPGPRHEGDGDPLQRGWRNRHQNRQPEHADM